MIELSVENLHLTYGDNPVLKGVSMTLGRGEVVSLLGPSGSGKTTLLRAVAGLEKPTSGRIAIGNRTVYDGTPRSEIPAEERNLGLVFQSYALYPHMTIYKNMAFSLLGKMSKEEIDIRVREAAHKLEIETLLDKKPGQLSGGQCQRVAVGRAIVRKPDVFLFDEPLSNLDAKLRESMRYEIKEIQKKLHITVVYVTHDQIEAMTMSDRVFIINRGIVQQVGTPLEIYRHPANQFVADFVGKVNFVKGTAERGIVRLKGIDQSLSYNGPLTGDVIVAIRPENIQLTEAEGHLRGKLASMFYLGDVNDCRVDIGNTELRVTADSMTYDTLQAGADVGLVLQDFLVYPDDGDEDFNKILT